MDTPNFRYNKVTPLMFLFCSIIYWGEQKPPPRYIFLCIKIGTSFSLFYTISNHTNKKGLKHIPTLDYTEFLQILK